MKLVVQTQALSQRVKKGGSSNPSKQERRKSHERVTKALAISTLRVIFFFPLFLLVVVWGKAEVIWLFMSWRSSFWPLGSRFACLSKSGGDHSIEDHTLQFDGGNPWISTSGHGWFYQKTLCALTHIKFGWNHHQLSRELQPGSVRSVTAVAQSISHYGPQPR